MEQFDEEDPIDRINEKMAVRMRRRSVDARIINYSA